MFGIVPAPHSASRTSGAGNLVYHNGPVEHTNAAYAIYWVPSGYSVSSDYHAVRRRVGEDRVQLLVRGLGDRHRPAPREHPNGSDADATINVTSHEHNETITDPNGNAWYDRRGYENGDKCAWKFGTPLGSTAFGQYSQLIDGHPYELQQEWSNASSSCALTGT